MALFADIVINDGQGTPAAHTFAKAVRDGDLVEWHDRSAGVLAGFKKISLRVRPASNLQGMYKVTIKVMDPKLAVTAPASGSGVQPNPTQAYFTTATHEFLIPAASDAQARKDILAYAKNLLSNSQISEAVELFAPPV